jgi:hypothetical protein
MSRVADEARSARAALDHMAGRITLVAQSMDPDHADRLQRNAARLRAALATATDPGLDADTRGALEAVEEQQALASRLGTLHESLLRRMETAVTGLESLTTRASEVVALGTSALAHHETSVSLRGLGDELEALRAGIDEASHFG